MQEFGEFGNIDIDKLVEGADRQFALMEEFQQGIGDLVGSAQDEAGMVTVEIGNEGLRDLVIHPKAMRMASADLSDTIKEVFAAASADFQQRMLESMKGVFGEGELSPATYLEDPEKATQRVKAAEEAYNRTFEDVMGELSRIKRQLDL